MISSKGAFYRNASNVIRKGFPWKQEPRKIFRRSGCQTQIWTSVTLIRFYYTLLCGNIQQEKQNFLSEKEKVPKTLKKVFGQS
jgi:hypothetical protein